MLWTRLLCPAVLLIEKDSLPVLKYGGSRDSAWAISCFASVDGMAVSDGHVLCLGTSVDQSKYDSVSSDTAHNIYLTVTPTEDFSENATTVKWLTGYSGGGKSFLGAKITRVNNDRFLVSWEEYGTSQAASTDDVLSESVLHYLFVDGEGNVARLASPKAKTIRASWKKDPQASGYQIQYAKNAKFTGRKGMVDIPQKSATAKTVSNLERGKKYYVRIRAYKKISGKKCYGAWSKAKTVKCK